MIDLLIAVGGVGGCLIINRLDWFIALSIELLLSLRSNHQKFVKFPDVTPISGSALVLIVQS